MRSLAAPLHLRKAIPVGGILKEASFVTGLAPADTTSVEVTISANTMEATCRRARPNSVARGLLPVMGSARGAAVRLASLTSERSLREPNTEEPP